MQPPGKDWSTILKTVKSSILLGREVAITCEKTLPLEVVRKTWGELGVIGAIQVVSSPLSEYWRGGSSSDEGKNDGSGETHCEQIECRK